MSVTPHSDSDVYCYLKQALEPACTVITEPLPGYYAADKFCYRVLREGRTVGELRGDFRSLIPGTLVQQARQLVAELNMSPQHRLPSPRIAAPQTPASQTDRPQFIASRLLPRQDARTWFSSGRAAFTYLISEVVRPRRVFLPTFVCWSLVDVMLQRLRGTELHFYSVDQQLRAELPDSLDAHDAVVDIHYFGHRSQLPRTHLTATILEDVSHCLIDNQWTDQKVQEDASVSDVLIQNESINAQPAINRSRSERSLGPVRPLRCYRFGSLRKAYRVADGGFADGRFLPVYEADSHPDAWLRLQATDWRDLREAENMTDRHFRISDISSQSLAVILTTDTAVAVRQRQANHAFLNQHFPCGQSVVPFTLDECPLLHIRKFASSAERDAVRQYLAERRIFTSIHWPVHDHLQHQRDRVNIEAALWIQDHTLAIPVAEDFDLRHMEWICQTAQEWCVAGATCFPHLHAG